MSEREDLELVTDFGSLRAGDLVVVKPCSWCGENHRGLLLAAFRAFGAWADGSTGVCLGYPIAPLPPCAEGRPFHRITAQGVAKGIVYRVRIPPAAETQRDARTRPLERVR